MCAMADKHSQDDEEDNGEYHVLNPSEHELKPEEYLKCHINDEDVKSIPSSGPKLHCLYNIWETQW